MKKRMQLIVLSILFFQMVQGLVSHAAMETRDYIQFIQSERFTELEDQLNALARAGEKDSDGMSSFHRALKRISLDLSLDPEPSLGLLNKWCRLKPSYLSYLMRGLFYIEFAWKERGNKYADKVLPEVWQTFKDRLWLAREDLLRSAQLNNRSPEPWIALMTVYRGMDMPLSVKDSFVKALEADPGHFAAYHMMLISKMEKWGGSNEDMMEFARQSYESHKNDPVFTFLLIIAHDEMAKRQALYANGKRSDYYKNPVNYETVRALVSTVLRAYPDSIKAMSWLAAIDYFNEKYADVYRLTRKMGDNVDEEVWGGKQSYLQTRDWLDRQHAKGAF